MNNKFHRKSRFSSGNEGKTSNLGFISLIEANPVKVRLIKNYSSKYIINKVLFIYLINYIKLFSVHFSSPLLTLNEPLPYNSTKLYNTFI